MKIKRGVLCYVVLCLKKVWFENQYSCVVLCCVLKKCGLKIKRVVLCYVVLCLKKVWFEIQESCVVLCCVVFKKSVV